MADKKKDKQQQIQIEQVMLDPHFDETMVAKTIAAAKESLSHLIVDDTIALGAQNGITAG
ncbi:hypothetical protein [Schleiferilactobacillus perolens]|uniref:Uncharacterized protein n=1 Tax=Schleiferilactobacillus perolens DSM 12744 TaxID=1423792 RepID=A0A0R1MZ05_9LACO|nr:hypothetical protein [Schleiferilactobacillus perolens]KRL12761.1 hypothetical protein FD09_GL002747 [Schleiferilactobacillus perolens DSM 12744]